MEKKSSKITVVQVIAFVISFVLAYFAANYFFSKNEETPNAVLMHVSKQMNQTMPKMMDSETRLDSTSVANETLNYHYTLINIVKDSSEVDFNLVKSEMIQKAQHNLDTNAAMKEYRENDISLHYIFTDKEKNPVFDYTVKYDKK